MAGNDAHLVVVLKVEGSELVLAGADIFSEADPTFGGKTITFSLAQQSGANYEDAISKLKDYVLYMARHSRAWAALLSMMHESCCYFQPQLLSEPKGQDNG